YLIDIFKISIIRDIYHAMKNRTNKLLWYNAQTTSTKCVYSSSTPFMPITKASEVIMIYKND
ncbi:MAG TPA: hypothetical protein VIR31_07435, partial [Nitrososphaeraceae archaeon]